jgi:hypothetical protein
MSSISAYEAEDRRNVITMVPIVESDGFTGDERFREIARRLLITSERAPRVMRTWWEEHAKGDWRL